MPLKYCVFEASNQNPIAKARKHDLPCQKEWSDNHDRVSSISFLRESSSWPLFFAS